MLTHQDFIELRDKIVRRLKLYVREPHDAYQAGCLRAFGDAIREVKKQFAEYEKAAFPEEPTDAPPSLIAKQKFLKLPMDERRRILEEQAEALAAYYEYSRDVDGIGGGDYDEEK